ncbi:hypothetical protein GCM10008022_28320 [Paenibacillus hunanensis]|nr:hypothetical protein GCM10008022_28320 [Paenibacillus hunanensis]
MQVLNFEMVGESYGFMAKTGEIGRQASKVIQKVTQATRRDQATKESNSKAEATESQQREKSFSTGAT